MINDIEQVKYKANNMSAIGRFVLVPVASRQNEKGEYQFADANFKGTGKGVTGCLKPNQTLVNLKKKWIEKTIKRMLND